MAAARPLFDDDNDGPSPFVYRPRRSLQIGQEYQAVIPEWEGPPGASASTTAAAVAPPPAVSLADDFPNLTPAFREAVLRFAEEHLPAAAKLSCLQTIQRILLNIVDNPTADKFRMVRLKAMNSAAVAMLQAVGFLPFTVGDGEQGLHAREANMEQLTWGSEFLVFAVKDLLQKEERHQRGHHEQQQKEKEHP